MDPRRPTAMDAALASARQTRLSLAALRRDVALSFRLCSRDFGVLGRELLAALALTQDRERAAARALDHERTARRRAQAKTLELLGPVRVVCRVRPMLPHEATRDGKTPVKVASAHDIHVLVPAAAMSTSDAGVATKSFAFERVVGEDASQQQLYKEVLPLVVAAVDGQHACVFAYGQTGAGKTSTIHGNESDRGIAFRAAETIFELVREQQHVFNFSVTVQMVEIYNEEMYDLLGAEDHSSPRSSSNGSTSSSMIMPFQTTAATGPPFVSRRPLGEIRHGEKGVYLRNVEAVAVHSVEDVMTALHTGEVNRTVQSSASSDNSEHSSRSHCVIMIDIQRCSHVDGQLEGGRFVIADLAGSERLIRTETSGSGQRVREAQHINKSLAAVGDVLCALLAKEKHVPYRNSKLTHLLQDSLGAADGQTLLLAHVSPSGEDVNETVNTLKFASRVNKHYNTSKRRGERQEMSRLQGTIATQAAQIQALQDKLAAELDLRRKYEKRLEEYRQEDHRRRAKDEERGRLTPSKQSGGPTTPLKVFGPSLPPNHQISTISSRLLATPEQPVATRRWSLYARKDTSKSLNGVRAYRVHEAAAGGQENISENIIRSRSPAVPKMPPVPEKTSSGMTTPVRRARRLSLMMNSERKASRSPLRVAAHAGGKRKTATPAEVRSILKKQRLSLEPTMPATDSTTDLYSHASGSKQVSFDLSSRSVARISMSQLPPLTAANATRSSLPPRQPVSMLRTPMNAGRVPAPAARVRTPSHAGIASPMTRFSRSAPSPNVAKSKWNGAGWR